MASQEKRLIRHTCKPFLYNCLFLEKYIKTVELCGNEFRAYNHIDNAFLLELWWYGNSVGYGSPDLPKR